MKAKTVESKLKEIVEKKFSGVSYVFDDWKAIDRNYLRCHCLQLFALCLFLVCSRSTMGV